LTRKKLRVLVFPGAFATRAIWRLHNQFRRLDLPTFERPATARWGKGSRGLSWGLSADLANLTSLI